jgi:hypothetical protein
MGRFFVRISNLIATEYECPEVFAFGGEVLNDFVYAEIHKLQNLFRATYRATEPILFGWAQYAAGMLEVATQSPWREEWQHQYPHFRPIYRGVSDKDKPTFHNVLHG